MQYYDELGVVRSLAASWANAAAIDPFVVRAAGRSIRHVVDLIALTELVAGIDGGAA